MPINKIEGDPLCIACDPETEIPLEKTALKLFFRFHEWQNLRYWIKSVTRRKFRQYTKQLLEPSPAVSGAIYIMWFCFLWWYFNK